MRPWWAHDFGLPKVRVVEVIVLARRRTRRLEVDVPDGMDRLAGGGVAAVLLVQAGREVGVVVRA